MATEGERRYFDAIGDEGRAHAIAKPFGAPDRAELVLEVGAVLSLLPPPPARVLDCGCGTGWLTWFLQRCGYDATGLDLVPGALHLARMNPPYVGLPGPRFVAGEVERMPFAGGFDAVLFFDSLHHSVDEVAALRSAWQALRPGGVCVTSEPGRGHADASRPAVETFGVTEKDMPAAHIRAVGASVGFSSSRMYARADEVGALLYRPGSGWRGWLRGNPLTRTLLLGRRVEWCKRDNGIVVLHR